MITPILKKTFEELIEVQDVDWAILDDVATSDSNILRPIKGVAFEEYFKKILISHLPSILIHDGIGDDDVDLSVNGHRLQLKTPVTQSIRPGISFGVALHKTHGDETKPNCLYKPSNKPFDFLVAFHPSDGILFVPLDKIPRHKKWPDYFADPACFPWDSEWINRWDLIGLTPLKGKSLDTRIVPSSSMLPKLSAATYLEDYEIITMLSKPEYFRAAVMGLKGNLKERWFKTKLQSLGFNVQNSPGAYYPYDLILFNKINEIIRIQIKGTSKGMCDISKSRVGFEMMGTHGQFPVRGYKKRDIDFVAIIISEHQLPSNCNIDKGLNFLLIPVNDLPHHHLIGNGVAGQIKHAGNEKWNLPDFNDVIYPNIKLKFFCQNGKVLFKPDIDAYRTTTNRTMISNSLFSTSGPYVLNEIPAGF